MRLTSFVVWKSWASNPVRTALTVVGIGLGIAVVTAIHVLDHNTIHSRLQQRLADYGRVDLELLPKDAQRRPGEVRQQLAGIARFVRDVGLLLGGESGAVVTMLHGERRGNVALYGLSPLPSRSFAFYDVALGDDLDDLSGVDRFVLVSERLGLQVGDEFELAPPAHAPTKRCVDGELVEVAGSAAPGERVRVTVKGILRDHALARRNGGAVVVGAYSLAQRVAPHEATFYQLNRVPGSNPEDLKRLLAEDFVVLDKRSAMVGEGADERAFRNGIKVLGLLALVLGMLVVFQTLSQTLLERLKQIGLMRCLGASRRAVAGIFLADGLLLAVLGAALGVLGGIGLAYLMARLQWTTLGVGKEIVGFEIPQRPVVFAAGLGVFFTLAGSAFPLFKARNLAPVQVLQARGLGDSGYLLRGVNVFLFLLLVVVLPVAYLAMTPLLAEESREMRDVLLQVGGIVLLFGGVLLLSPKIVHVGGGLLLAPLRRRLPLPAFLVDKALARGGGRFAAAVCGLAVVLVAMVALEHITASLRAEVRQFSSRTMDAHVFCDSGDQPAKSADDLRALHTIPGVRGVECFAGEAKPGFLLRGLSADSLARPGGLLEGDAGRLASYRESRTLIVSRRWAELHWKQAGQRISLLTGSGERAYTILLVSDRAGFFPDERAWAIADPGWLRRDFCVEAASVRRLALEVDPGADAEALRAAIQEVFPHGWFKRGADIRDQLLRDVTRDFFLFDVLLLLILVLVGVGMVNTMTIAAVGRAREIGVLRALGMEEGSLRRTFLLEGAVVAVLAAVLAIAMGLPLGAVVVMGLNRVAGLDAPVVVPWGAVGLVPVLALATGLLAALLPASRAIRIDPAEAVRYE